MLSGILPCRFQNAVPDPRPKPETLSYTATRGPVHQPRHMHLRLTAFRLLLASGSFEPQGAFWPCGGNEEGSECEHLQRPSTTGAHHPNGRLNTREPRDGGLGILLGSTKIANLWVPESTGMSKRLLFGPGPWTRSSEVGAQGSWVLRG